MTPPLGMCPVTLLTEASESYLLEDMQGGRGILSFSKLFSLSKEMSQKESVGRQQTMGPRTTVILLSGASFAFFSPLTRFF